MSQIKFPTELPQQIALLNSIITKNNNDGDSSPLAAWLVQQGIDLAADQVAGKKATEQEKIRAEQDATGKMAFKRRDTLFTPVITFVHDGAQVLKKFYKPDYPQLAIWNLPITQSGRINYPSSFEDQNEMAANFFTKLLSFGEGKSPLAAYIKTNSVNVNNLVTNNTDAAEANAAAGVAAKAAENATEQRDLLWAMPLKHIHDIAEYLKTIYPNNPRALGEWGFVVDESVAVRKERKVMLIIGETKVVDSVRIGSIVTNLSTGNVLLYKGKGIRGTETVLKANEKMGMVKGYSIITLVNPSTLEKAVVLIEFPE